MTHFRKLERLYLSAPCNRYYAPVIAIEKGRTELRIPLKPEFFHAAHAVHGSVYFKALDDAGFFAANSLVEDVFVLTMTFQLYLLRPVTQGVVIARGEVVHQTRSSFVADSVLHDGDGNQIARGSGTFVRSGIKLDPTVGYR